MCKVVQFDSGNGSSDNDTAMEIKKSLLLSFLYIHSFISALGSATSKKSIYRQKRNDRNCVCFETNPHRKTIPQILDPTNKGIERLIIIAYRTPDGTIYTYIPEMNKQSGWVFPDFQFEDGDFLDINAEEPLQTIFVKHKKINDLGYFWRDQPIPRPQDNKSNINKPSKRYQEDHPVKPSQKRKPYKPGKKQHVILKDLAIPQDSEFKGTPLNGIRKHRLFWKDLPTISQESGAETFIPKDSIEFNGWTDNQFTNKPTPHKNINNHDNFWQEMRFPHNVKPSKYVPSLYPSEKDNAKKTKQNHVTNKQKPTKNIIDKLFPQNMPSRKNPDKLTKLSNVRIQGPIESVTWQPTDSKEDEKTPPLFYYSDSDKDEYPILFEPHSKNFRYIPKITDKNPQLSHQHPRYIPNVFDRVKPKYIPVTSEEIDGVLEKELHTIEIPETSLVPNSLKDKYINPLKYPKLYDPYNINFKYIPEITDKEPKLSHQRQPYIPLKPASKGPNYVFDRVKPKYIPATSEENDDLFKKELHNMESPETSFFPNDLKQQIFIDKHRPMHPLTKELDSINMFLIDEDMLDDRWKTNIRENFGPISSKQRGRGETFDKWFIKEMKNNDLGISIKQRIDYKTLQYFVEVALKRHGMFVSPKGDLRDSNGNSLDMGNINLRRLLIGDSLEYYRLRKNPDGTLRFPKNSSYMESLLIALLHPPKIIGIIPLGKIKLPSPLDISSVPKHPKQYTTSEEHKELEDISAVYINNNKDIQKINKVKPINSNNEFIMVNPINNSLGKSSKSKVQDEIGLTQTFLDIFNDSVPITKSKYNHDFKLYTNTEHDLPRANSEHRRSKQDSSELQALASLLHTIIDKSKDDIIPVNLNRDKLLAALGISSRDKKVLDPLVLPVQSSQKRINRRKEKSKPVKISGKNKKKEKSVNLLSEEAKSKKEEAQSKKEETKSNKNKKKSKAKAKAKQISSENEEPQKEVAKSNKTLKKKKKPHFIPRVLNSIHNSVVGGANIDDNDHDFRIIGGLAATGSGRPINNRGRSGDKDISYFKN